MNAANKTIKKGDVLLFAIIAIPAVIVMRYIRPWVHIRLGTFNTARMGHFAIDVAMEISSIVW